MEAKLLLSISLTFSCFICLCPAFSKAEHVLANNFTNSEPSFIHSTLKPQNLDNLTSSEGLVAAKNKLTANEKATSNRLSNQEIKEFSNGSTTVALETTTPNVLQKWKGMENITKFFVKEIIKGMLPNLMEQSDEIEISTSCKRDLFRLLVGLREIKTWAVSFLDSSGKLIDGMLSGTLSILGDFDQCLDTKAIEKRRGKNFGKVMFTGKYCALDLKPPLPPKKKKYKVIDVADELKEFAKGDNIINEAAKSAESFHFIAARSGICVPSGCETSDIQKLANMAVKESYWTVHVKRCEVKEEYDISPFMVSILSFNIFLLCLLIAGSFIDLYYKYAQKKIKRTSLEILVSFSLVTNFKKLVNVKNARGKLSCLNGFRFLSISWIILGHTYFNANYTITKSIKRTLDWQQDFFFNAIFNASVAVDTFFFIGGFLVCYLTVTVIRETKKPFNIFLYILHRLFRLFPVYAAIILFTFLGPNMGSGPVFHDTIDPFMNYCYKNWWTNLLFVNNFINAKEMCLPHSWYVACDMQLYITALIVIIPILRWPRVGLCIASLGIIGSAITTAVIAYVNNYPPTMLFVHPDLEHYVEFSTATYFKPYIHAGPYCVGLIVGYMLATKPNLKFSMATKAVGWTLAIACNMATLYGVFNWNRGMDPTTTETVFYSGLHRIAWSLGIAWIIVLCATNQGGVVNYILSWNVWVPLGRLTYCLYLIHPIVQISILSNARIRLQASHYFAVWMFFGHLMITLGSSFVASMLVEAPFINLEKLFIRAIVGKTEMNRMSHHATTSDSTVAKSRLPLTDEITANRDVSRL